MGVAAVPATGIEERRGMAGEGEQDFVEHGRGGGGPPADAGSWAWPFWTKAMSRLSSSKRHMKVVVQPARPVDLRRRQPSRGGWGGGWEDGGQGREGFGVAVGRSGCC